MKFKLKTYKFYKLKYYLKNEKFFIFYHGVSLKFSSWILKLEQVLKPLQLDYYRVRNIFMKKEIKKSIFKNLIFLISGSIILLTPKTTKNLTFNKLKNITPLLGLICVKLNNKIYTSALLKNFNNLSYHKNIMILQYSIKAFLKIPALKLKKSL